MKIRSLVKDWYVEIIALAINLGLGYVVLWVSRSSPLDKIAISEDAEFITIATVASVSILLIALKTEILGRIRQHLEIYRLLDAIDSPELRQMAVAEIESCKERLVELSKGVVTDDTPGFRTLLSQKLLKVSETLQATHVATTLDEIYQWETSRLGNYLEINKELAQEKKVERIFILRKSVFELNGILDSRTDEIINQQAEWHIAVYLVWEEDLLDRTLWEDYIIIDGNLVVVNEPTGSAVSGGWKRILKTDSKQVEQYKERFEVLKTELGKRRNRTLGMGVCPNKQVISLFAQIGRWLFGNSGG